MNMFKNKIWLYTAILVAIIVVIILILSLRNGNYETVDVKVGDLNKIVEISGKVVPAEEVDLSFVASGKVINVYKDVGDQVRVGDILAEIDGSEIRGEILEAQANLQSAQAELDKISGNGNSSQIDIARDSLVKTLNKAFVNADSIIRNNVDTFFVDSDTINAEFRLSLGSPRRELNDGREVVEKSLDDWYERNNSITIENVSASDISYALQQLSIIDNFVALISSYSSDFEPQSDITQAQIDAYVSSLATARSTISSLNIDINSAYDTLSGFESDIPVQNAKIDNTRATVSRLQTKAGDYVLRAPFNGVITENNLELGKISGSGDVAFVLISDSPLEIETFIPEINVVGVDVGDKVNLKFDALGADVVVDATVTQIDPRATVKDGVVTYRTLIDLIEPNENLKPGMSTDIEILKEVVSGQIIIPTYVVQDDENGSYVEVKNGKDDLRRVNVEILDTDNRGNVSVSGDLSVGDQLVILKS